MNAMPKKTEYLPKGTLTCPLKKCKGEKLMWEQIQGIRTFRTVGKKEVCSAKCFKCQNHYKVLR